jgi:DNA-binding MarR family transcriptional regulator
MDQFTETRGALRHNEKTSAFDDAVVSSQPGTSQRSIEANALVANESRMDGYFKVISLVERLHRQFLELVKLELDGLGIHDINNVQGMILFSIGDAEMTVGELTLRGCYLGSNVSYNVKKMVENGYLAQQRSLHDRRSIHVQLTAKGRKLHDNLTEMHQRHYEMLSQVGLTADDLQGVGTMLRRLEQFWIRAAGP